MVGGRIITKIRTLSGKGNYKVPFAWKSNLFLNYVLCLEEARIFLQINRYLCICEFLICGNSVFEHVFFLFFPLIILKSVFVDTWGKTACCLSHRTFPPFKVISYCKGEISHTSTTQTLLLNWHRNQDTE